MADNRMFLIHKPTKLGVMLAGRLGSTWDMQFGAGDSLAAFYEHLNAQSLTCERQDDFVLAMEDCSNSSCFGDWQYTNESVNGFRVFEFTNQEAQT